MAPRKYRPRRRPARKYARKYAPKRYARKPLYRKKRFIRSSKSKLNSVKVKCNGQVQPYAKYTQPPPYWKSKMERLYSTAQKNYYKQLVASSLSGANGSQGVFQHFIWSRSDINSALSTITGLAPGTTGQVKNTSRIYLQRCILNFTFTNSSNAPIEFDIYVFNCKRDAEDSLVTLWESGTQDMIGTALPDTNSIQYGNTPLSNPAVSQYHKCAKIFHYVVNPGQMFKYSHENNLHRLINNEMLNPDLQTDEYFRGISQTLLFVSKGTPCQNSVTTSLTTTALHEVNFVMTKLYSFKYIEDRNINMNDVTDLDNVANTVYNMSGFGTAQNVASANV